MILTQPSQTDAALAGAAFHPEDAAAYARWRQAKLGHAAAAEQPVIIADPARLSAAERAQLLQRLRRDNLVWYRLDDPDLGDAGAVRLLGEQLGLIHLDANLYAEDDGVSAIRVKQGSAAGEFIPYTDRAINWHTDGYYNPPERRVRAFILHCVRPAASGGENWLLDFERVYIQLRDHHPRYLQALMAEAAFSIPPLISDGVEQRGWTCGPVFSVDDLTGALHMRYSARLRNVRWADDSCTREAAACLRELIDADPGVIRLTLAAGEGLISNNVLHARTAFSDTEGGEGRLLLRARYHDRVMQTHGENHAVAE